MRRCAIGFLFSVAACTFGFAQDKPKDNGSAGGAKAPTAREKPSDAKPSAEPSRAEKPNSTGTPITAASASSPLDFTLRDIDGNEVALSKFKGKVVLLVNVASKCGLTPQYEQLQQLYDDYAGKGLAILAFPANNFGAQEPGTNEEIKSFCKTKFRIGFDLFEKISVKGDDTHELYRFLTSKEKNEKLGGEVKWNFTKFLVGRDGKLIERFEPKVKPDDAKVTKAIRDALDVVPTP